MIGPFSGTDRPRRSRRAGFFYVRSAYAPVSHPLSPGRIGVVRNTVILLLFLIFLGSCSSGPDPIASFVTADGPQYFLRPITFRGTAADVPVDMTIIAEQADRPVQVNFTLPLEIASGLTAATFTTTDGVYPLSELERYYATVDEARYGGTLEREYFDLIRAHPERPQFSVSSANGTHSFTAPSVWTNRMETLNRILY